jgi:hypothetical protein
MKPTSLGMFFVVATALAIVPALGQPRAPEVHQTDRERIKADRARMDEAMKRETTKRPWDGMPLLRRPAVEAPAMAPLEIPR